MPAEYKDAYYQLVLHPVMASANLNELYVTVAKNRFYAKRGLAPANAFADKAKQLYIRDSLISKYYNDTLAGGKWSHMMDQTHIGYTYWQQPLRNKMPDVVYIDPNAPIKASNIENVNDKKTFNLIPKTAKGNSFTQVDGYVSVEAEHYTKAVTSQQIKWQVIPNLGRTLSAVEAFPVTAKSQTISTGSPHLEYNIYVTDTGTAKVITYLSPTLNFHNEGHHYGISIDDEKPQVINMHEGNAERLWNQWVADNIIKKTSEHKILKPGLHVLKFWRVDPAVILQKLVVDLGGLKESYLGPPETLAK